MPANTLTSNLQSRGVATVVVVVRAVVALDQVHQVVYFSTFCLAADGPAWPCPGSGKRSGKCDGFGIVHCSMDLPPLGWRRAGHRVRKTQRKNRLLAV